MHDGTNICGTQYSLSSSEVAHARSDVHPPLWIPSAHQVTIKNWQELMNCHPTYTCKFLVMAGSEYLRDETATTQHMADATKASWRLLGGLAGSLETTDQAEWMQQLYSTRPTESRHHEICY